MVQQNKTWLTWFVSGILASWTTLPRPDFASIPARLNWLRQICASGVQWNLPPNLRLEASTVADLLPNKAALHTDSLVTTPTSESGGNMSGNANKDTIVLFCSHDFGRGFLYTQEACQALQGVQVRLTTSQPIFWISDPMHSTNFDLQSRPGQAQW